MTSTTQRIVQSETSNFHQAFPTVIYEKHLPGHLSAIYKSFDDGKFDNSTGKVTGELNGKVLLHQDTRLEPFFKEVKSSILEYVDHFNIEDCFDINFVKSWFTICDPGQSVPMHWHSCSHISYVYYVQTPGDPLVLHRRNPNEWFGDAFQFKTDHNYCNGDGYVITPKAEHLVVFPGSLEHYTAPEDREHTRISIAGDVILTLKDRIDKEAGLLHPRCWKQF